MSGQWTASAAGREAGMVTVTFTRPDAPAARLHVIIIPAGTGDAEVVASRAVYADPEQTRPWHPVVYGATGPVIPLRVPARLSKSSATVTAALAALDERATGLVFGWDDREPVTT